MTFANFKQSVLNFVNRNNQTFNAPDMNYVLTSMNDVRRAAQRDYTFNLNRRPAFVQVSMIGQSMLTDFYTAPDGVTAVAVKQIDALNQYSSTTVSDETVYYRTGKVRYRSYSQMSLELPDAPSNGGVIVNNSRTGVGSGFCYLQGVNLYHSTLTTPTWVMADVVAFLPDHAGDASEDIFLTYFADWLKWATILQLNQYLTETTRFQIDTLMVDNLWESVKQYDAQQAVSTGSIDLD